MKKVGPNPQIVPTEAGVLQIKEEDVKKYLTKVNVKETPGVVFFGSDSWSILVLKELEDNFDVQAVVCAPDSAVSNYFKGPVLTPEKLDENFQFLISNFKIQIMVVASYGKIIPQAVLDIPKFGALNVHPSLLPKYRGASPVPATILNGEKTTGVTIIKMDAKMDHGPIVSTMEISLSGQEDFLELINKLFRAGAELLVKIIPDYLAGKVPLKEQNHEEATFTKLLKREDGFFDLPAGRQELTPSELEQLDRMIRAYSPWPGVWTKWKERIVKFLPSEMVQIEGKKPVTWKVFLNGYPDFPIKNLN